MYLYPILLICFRAGESGRHLALNPVIYDPNTFWVCDPWYSVSLAQL